MSYSQPDLSLLCRDFSPGYLDTPEADALPPGATPDARNFMFARISEDPPRVTIKKRDGHRLVTPFAVFGSGIAIDGMAEFRRVATTQALLGGSNGSLMFFNNDDAWATIISGFTAGNPMRFAFQKGQCIAMDGTFMRRVNSALAAFPVGLAAPTAAQSLSAAAGPGVTGQYEGYAVWYDQLTDHESSPGLKSGVVTFANEQRVWGRPGTPPANATHWRVYCRRVDTNEANYFRAGTFTAASTSGTEATSDAARVNIGPRPGVNDPPPGAFALMGTFRGYAIGVLPNDTTYYVSKVNDFESWNPSDAFKVSNGRAEIRVVRSFGTQFLIQTSVASFTLEGDQVPFRIVEAHTNYGCISQDASGEVSYRGGNRYYGWDEAKGPYWWDGAQTWMPMANNRVWALIDQINRSALNKIRFVHDTQRHLVMWCLPLHTSTRPRLLLAYDYTLDRWLPPITGLEVGALAEFTNPTSGVQSVYLGDLWGRLYELFAQDTDGVPSGFTTTATVTAATTSTVTADAATFYTAGTGMVGLQVAVRSPAGVWQWRRIQSNDSTTITLDTTNDTPWDSVPLSGWTVIVGGIEAYWTTPWGDFGRPDRYKRLSYLILAGKTSEANTRIEIYTRYNDSPGYGAAFQVIGAAAAGGSGVWGEGVWGVSLWSSAPRTTRKLRMNRTCLTMQLRIENFYPAQPVEITGYGVEGDWLPRRRVIGRVGG